MNNKVKRKLALIIFGVLGVALAVVAIFYYGCTVVSWWLLAGAVLPGLLAVYVLRGIRGLIGELAGSAVSWLAVFVFGTVAGLAFLLWGNCAFADPSGEHKELVTVESKHIRERQHRRYVRGRYIGSGRKYNTYYLRLRFDDGNVKEVQVEQAEYNRTRTGSEREYTLMPGAFGMPVIKR